MDLTRPCRLGHQRPRGSSKTCLECPCSKCGAARDSDFSWCRACNSKRNVIYHRQTDRKGAKAYKARHPEFTRQARRVYKVNWKAQQRGIEGRLTPAEWREVITRQGSRCNHCSFETKLTIDHIVPLDLKGPNVITNIQGLCMDCNTRKGNTPWETFHGLFLPM